MSKSLSIEWALTRIIEEAMSKGRDGNDYLIRVHGGYGIAAVYKKVESELELVSWFLKKMKPEPNIGRVRRMIWEN